MPLRTNRENFKGLKRLTEGNQYAGKAERMEEVIGVGAAVSNDNYELPVTRDRGPSGREAGRTSPAQT